LNSISVIIPTFRRIKYLLNVVKCLLNQTRIPDEIIIIDQTPSQETRNVYYKILYDIIKKYNFIKYVYQKEPLVYKARNLGAKIAKSDILLYLDDDIIPDKNLVKAHLENYKNPEVVAVVGIAKSKNWRPLRSPEGFEKWPPLKQAFKYYPFINKLSKIAFMYAGNFSIKKEILVKIGGWDEHISTYGDREIGLRLYYNNYRIDYDPKAIVFHLEAKHGGTRLSDPNQPWKSHERAKSILYLAFKHLRGYMFIKHGLFRAARHTFLLKRNLLNPLKIPFEFIGFIKGCFIAYKLHKKGIKSPFVKRN